MAAPTVSVIIIAFQAEDFLGEAVDSVLAQTFSDYEILIADDGSTDGTRNIAEAYAFTYPERVRLLRHPDRGNHGISATRNLALAHARGEYVAFLDADDVWLPAKLAEQVAILQAHPEVGLVYGRARIWRSWNGAGEDFFYDLGVAADAVHTAPGLFRRQLRNQDQTPTTSGSMMRAALVRSVGGCEPAFPAMFEDQALFAKLMLDNATYVSGATWFNYRQHPTSVSARSAARRADEPARLAYLNWLSGHLRALPGHAEDCALVRAQAQALRNAMLKAQVSACARRFLRPWSPSL